MSTDERLDISKVVWIRIKHFLMLGESMRVTLVTLPSITRSIPKRGKVYRKGNIYSDCKDD
jgi:hypothetical protein